MSGYIIGVLPVIFAVLAVGSASDDVEVPPLRDSRIFTIDFGNSTTSLANLSAWSSIIALKAKVAAVIAVFWAAASLFHKYIGSVGLCRTSYGYSHGDHHSIGDLYGSGAFSQAYQEPSHSTYGSYSSPISGRPARAERQQELSPTGILTELVELAKERVALANVAIGAIEDVHCRRQLLCWASSVYSNAFGEKSSASSDGKDGGHLFTFGDYEECMEENENGSCPSSPLSMALSALTRTSQRPGFDA